MLVALSLAKDYLFLNFIRGFAYQMINQSES